MSKLLPCPFCGGEARIVKQHLPSLVLYGVECYDCPGSTGTVRFTEAEAAELWNRRAQTLFGLTYREIYALKYGEERTCSIEERDELPYSVCSVCGAVQPDDYTVYYCWSCGAKVIA